MKTTRRIFTLALAIMMIMALAIPAFAATTYTIKISNTTKGHTYAAYQIFTGDLSGTTLSNIVWGADVTADGQTALGNAADKAEFLVTATAAEVEAFAAEVAKYVDSTPTKSVTATSTTVSLSSLPAGYYLIQTTATPDVNGVKTYYILKLSQNVTVAAKAAVPTVTKTVDDANASIGQEVTFTLTATMPSTLAGYEKYKVVFDDTLSAGLDFVEGSVTVKIGSTDKTDAFTVAEKNGALTITCADVIAQGATTKTKIVATYKAIVDSDAVIGSEGNPNTVKLVYSNDPNWDGTGTEPTGETPEKEVEVFTWEIPVYKVDGEDKALAGAGFTLYTDAECTKAVNLTATSDATIFKACMKEGCSETHVTEIVTGSTGKFQIEGLDLGTYYLKETTTPAGYNTCAVVTVVIGAEGALTQDGTTTSEVKIINNAGTVLPSTGGIGTTIFYIVGGILLVGAAVLLITKRRMNTI